MRVLINTLSALEHKIGVGHYAVELARALQEASPGSVVTYPTALSAAMQRWWGRQASRYEANARGTGLASRLKMHTRGKFLALVRKTVLPPYPVRLEAAARDHACDLYHEPNVLPIECDRPTVATVPDLSPLTHPEWHPATVCEEVERRCRDSLSRCAHLFAVSRFGKRQLVEQLGIDPDRVTVTYPGVRPGMRFVPWAETEQALQAMGLGRGYLLHVGSLEPRKNLPMLFRAYTSLPEAVRRASPLVMVGPGAWQCEAMLDYLRGDGLAKNIHYRGYVSDEALSVLYSGARALVLPGFEEGFGLPAVEMLACGGVVLAANSGALPEVTGGKALLIDPHDEDGWRAALMRACRDRDWRVAAKAGAREAVAHFTWSDCAERTLEGYRRALAPAAARLAA